MCTVTFLPLNNKDFILTSNRDEQSQRVTLAPQKYVEDEVALYYPKDLAAGGTWIGTSNKNRLVCVLNGGFTKHTRKSSYKKSRGLIAKELLKEIDFISYINNLDLSGVEPFTMIIVDYNSENLGLYELVWDDKKIHFKQLANTPHIWSSSTLYSTKIKNERKEWFQNWLAHSKINADNILKFHHSEVGDKSQSILMKRSYVETVSISQVQRLNEQIIINYEDVIHSTTDTLVY